MATHTAFGWDLKRWLVRPGRRRQRRLQLLETLSLGEKRLVGVLAVDGREFLIGATPHSLSLLSPLGDESEADYPAILPASEVQ